ncbi:MAG: 4-(cytidine 5'-diphospho)-2-C-methyl-D-erythritol kinase [Oscillospiraceae bacterium]|nr:4-(cytidine 5'-diphospho)-2-C-methyl-D-erythritol kinase [Oscillospiraceae bacterium]
MLIKGKRAVLKSYGKINLTLDVAGRRANGYHDVSMIMQTIGLFDSIIVDRCSHSITVSSNLKYLPDNEKNIAYRAAAEFFEYTGIRGGVMIRIQKNIPVAAGLAGGSSNAAAVLVALNVLYNKHLSVGELCKIGVKLGADIPYCLTGGTCLSEGIGEILTPVAALPGLNVVLVKPPVNISTAVIYEKIDSVQISARPDNKEFIKALESGDVRRIGKLMCNVMEEVTVGMCPEIRSIKNNLIDDGALGAVMSGSGPTVFGLFDDYEAAKKSMDKFYKKYNDVFLCRTKDA